MLRAIFSRNFLAVSAVIVCFCSTMNPAGAQYKLPIQPGAVRPATVEVAAPSLISRSQVVTQPVPNGIQPQVPVVAPPVSANSPQGAPSLSDLDNLIAEQLDNVKLVDAAGSFLLNASECETVTKMLDDGTLPGGMVPAATGACDNKDEIVISRSYTGPSFEELVEIELTPEKGSGIADYKLTKAEIDKLLKDKKGDHYDDAVSAKTILDELEKKGKNDPPDKSFPSRDAAVVDMENVRNVLGKNTTICMRKITFVKGGGTIGIDKIKRSLEHSTEIKVTLPDDTSKTVKVTLKITYNQGVPQLPTWK